MARRPVARDATAAKKSRSWGGILFGFIFFAVGVAVGLGFPTKSTFQCERDAQGDGDCAIIESAVAWTSLESVSVRELTGATVEMDDGDEGPVCRVALTMADGRYVPLSIAWTTCSENMTFEANKITAFATSKEPGELVIDNSIGGWIFLFVTVFVLAGLFVMVTSARER